MRAALALALARAPRGGGTPHCGVPSSALRIPLIICKAEGPCDAWAFRTAPAKGWQRWRAVVSALASEQASRAEPFAERRSSGVSALRLLSCNEKAGASDTELAPTRRRERDSPRGRRPACAPRGAASCPCSPGRENAALRHFLFRPSNPSHPNAKRKAHARHGSSPLAKGSNFDRNPLRGCNYGLEGGAFLILGGCSSLPKEEERLHEIMC